MSAEVGDPKPLLEISPVDGESREQQFTRWILAAGLVLAILVAGAAAWLTWHPLAGAGVLVLGFGVLWHIVTEREHKARLSRDRAEAGARARQVSTAGFETARPQAPAAPFGGG